MAQHHLSLEAPDTLNLCILRLVDTSVYDSNLSVKCPRLQVTVPGFTYAKTIEGIQPEFIKNLTACDLGIQKDACGRVFNNLPDGIYILKYSVSPNDVVYVEYNHLRISWALTQVRAILCDIDVSGCKPDQIVQKKLDQLREIQDMLMAAKAKVETCGEPKKGMDIYNYAVKLLNKIECRTCHK